LVHGAFKKFKKEFSGWGVVSEKAYYELMG